MTSLTFWTCSYPLLHNSQAISHWTTCIYFTYFTFIFIFLIFLFFFHSLFGFCLDQKCKARICILSGNGPKSKICLILTVLNWNIMSQYYIYSASHCPQLEHYVAINIFILLLVAWYFQTDLPHYFSPWMNVANNLQMLVKNERLRDVIHKVRLHSSYSQKLNKGLTRINLLDLWPLTVLLVLKLLPNTVLPFYWFLSSLCQRRLTLFYNCSHERRRREIVVTSANH